jgi:hypothetical protein
MVPGILTSDPRLSHIRRELLIKLDTCDIKAVFLI